MTKYTTCRTIYETFLLTSEDSHTVMVLVEGTTLDK